MRALVSGANGFIGSAIVRALLSEGWQVRALVRAASCTTNLADYEVELVTGDLRDADSILRAARGCEIAFHVGADYRLWVPDPTCMYEVNVRGSERFITAAANSGLERIVYTSSVATLGLPEDGSAGDEDTPVSVDKMIGHYKRSKFLAEAAVRRLAAENQWPVIIVNPSAPLGPGDIKPTPTGRMILDAMRGVTPAYVDTGLSICHVDDVARGHVLALQSGRPGERYVLGGENLHLLSILTQVAELLGRAPPKIRLPHSVAMAIACISESCSKLTGTEPRVTRDSVRMSRRRMYYSSAKAMHELGYQPRPACMAIQDSVRWFSG